MVLLKPTSGMPASAAIIKWCTNGPSKVQSGSEKRNLLIWQMMLSQSSQQRNTRSLFPIIICLQIFCQLWYYIFIVILYFPQYFRSWWCLCEPVIRYGADTWHKDVSLISQSEASIEVTWSALTNERPVLWRGVNWGVQGDKRKLRHIYSEAFIILLIWYPKLS